MKYCFCFNYSQFVILIIVIFINTSYSHLCGHIPPEKSEVYHVNPGKRDPHPDEKKRASVRRKRSTEQNIRIKVIYGESVNELDNDRRTLLKVVLLPEAISYWNRVLKVRHVHTPILLHRSCSNRKVKYINGQHQHYCLNSCKTDTKCGEVKVDPQYLERCRVAYMYNETLRETGEAGPGAWHVDFLLFTSAAQSDNCAQRKIIAYASYCQLEAVYDRPIAGFVNICPERISTLPTDREHMLYTVKHEILHALGFSSGLYAFYRDDLGRPLSERIPMSGLPYYDSNTKLYMWSDKVIRSVDRYDWLVRNGNSHRRLSYIVTPRVKEEVRRHFNCSHLIGAELEDQLQLSTALTHFEKRVFKNEAMTGTYTRGSIISRITLALMEDTGWYWADYSLAQPLEWGRDLGCDFCMNSCMHWMEERRKKKLPLTPWCDDSNVGVSKLKCSEDRDSLLICNIRKYHYKLDQGYQNFKYLKNVNDEEIDQYGGIIPLADYCPYYQEFHWNNEKTRSSICSLSINNQIRGRNHLVETYGNSSKCFEHESVWTRSRCANTYTLDHFGAGCYEYSCSPVYGLTLHVGSRQYPCPVAGQIIAVKDISTNSAFLYEGHIVCPSCELLCPQMECPKVVPVLDAPAHPSVPCGTPTIYGSATYALVILVTVATLFA